MDKKASPLKVHVKFAIESRSMLEFFKQRITEELHRSDFWHYCAFFTKSTKISTVVKYIEQYQIWNHFQKQL